MSDRWFSSSTQRHTSYTVYTRSAKKKGKENDSPREVLLKIVVLKNKYLPGITCNRRADHVTNCNSFTRDFKQFTNSANSQLGKPLRTLFSESTYHRLISKGNEPWTFKWKRWKTEHRKLLHL